MAELSIGSTCVFPYKSGTYIGTLTEFASRSNRAVVMIQAVLEHPLQGDLHHPYATDVPLFHERKASAFGEQVLVPLGQLEAFDGEVPEYTLSLRHAYEQSLAAMKARGDTFGELSVRCLEQVRSEYGSW